MTIPTDTDRAYRHHAGAVVATLTRILGPSEIDLIEEVVQDAFVKALRTWPYTGTPTNPRAWLTEVAKNRARDQLRRRTTWQRKATVLAELATGVAEPAADTAYHGEVQDSVLAMMFACCTPELPRHARVALTLKTVGGFSVAELARAFLTKPTTMARRVLRAKDALRAREQPIEIPEPDELPARLRDVHDTIYLLFNEGHSPSTGERVVDADLVMEACRLAELVARHPVTCTPTSNALAALLLLTAARLDGRVDADGAMLLLPEQDRSAWSRPLIHRGVRYLSQAASGDSISAFHVQAEIAACHTLAKSWAQTPWTRIVECYDSLLRLQPSPIVRLNRAVALAESGRLEAALAEVESLAEVREMSLYYPFFVVRADLARRDGQHEVARDHYQRALALEPADPIKRLCQQQLSAL